MTDPDAVSEPPSRPAGPAPLIGRWSRQWLPGSDSLWHLTLTGGYQPVTDHQQWTLLHRGPHSYIYQAGDHPADVVKLAMPRSTPRDSLRKYVACQAKREYHGNRALNAIGLQTPATHGWGVTLSPFARFESALFMQALPDFVSGLTLIRTETDTGRRHQFLRTLAEQLACLHGHGYIHKDAHFANLCILADDTLVWIDNDIRKPRTIGARRKGLAKTLMLLANTARNDITAPEWLFFRHTLRADLADWPQGEQLAHEVS